MAKKKPLRPKNDFLDMLQINTFQGQDQLHYFNFLNEQGDVVLSGKGYQSDRQRDNALSKVQEYALDSEKTKVVKYKNQFRLVIKAGNNQILAKSPSYSSRDYPDKLIGEFQQKTNAEKKVEAAPSPAIQKLIPINSKSKKEIKEEKQQEPQHRFNFDLTFYVQEETGKVVGKIEYPLEKERVSFENLDLSVIQKFISKFLPNQPKVLPQPIKKAIPVQQEKPVRKENEVIPKNLEPSLVILEKGKVVNKSVFTQFSDIEFQARLPKVRITQKEQSYKARIYAKSLKKGNSKLVTNLKGIIPPNGKFINLSLKNQNGLNTKEVYQFSVEIDFYDTNSNARQFLYRMKLSSKLIKFVNGAFIKIGFGS